MPPSSRRRAPWAVLVAVCLGLVGCGDDGRTAGCGPIQRETLDPAYLVHVLGSDTAVEYGSDPPTSGPHQPGLAESGVLDEPLPRPVQVGILERGDVLLQHGPELPADDLAALEALAGGRVTVAPNPDLPEPVVATAWVFKQSCSTVDAAALEEFIDERVGQGPED